jgi:hypothetical protein
MGTFWLRIRLAMYAFALLVAVATPFFVQPPLFAELRDLPLPVLVVIFVSLVVLVAALPLMVVIVIGVQSANPWSDKQWTRPTLRTNPFGMGNPLNFLLDGAVLVGIGGCGFILSSLWNGPIFAAAGLLQVFGAAMLFAGLQLCMRVFKHKVSSQVVERSARPGPL